MREKERERRLSEAKSIAIPTNETNETLLSLSLTRNFSRSSTDARQSVSIFYPLLVETSRAREKFTEGRQSTEETHRCSLGAKEGGVRGPSTGTMVVKATYNRPLDVN